MTKDGLFTSAKKADTGFFGVVKAYENGKLIWQETIWDICRITKADALFDAETLKAEMLA